MPKCPHKNKTLIATKKGKLTNTQYALYRCKKCHKEIVSKKITLRLI